MSESQGDGLKSRKFWVTIVGLFVVLLLAIIAPDILADSITGIGGIVGAYVVGQSYADGQVNK